MPDLPADFDLKLMPDWLKEPATKNPYADYQGDDSDRRSRGGSGGDWGGRGRQDDRRGRPGGGQRPGGAPRRDDRGPNRGPKSDAPGGARKPDGRRPDRPPGRSDDRRGTQGSQGSQGEGRRSDSPRDSREHQQAPPSQPANVTIEFFPDESCSVSIARQIKSTHRAYSLFDLARMFLARPERHHLKIATKTVAEPLFQVGKDGPVSLDRAAAERAAFPIARDKFYVEVTEQRDVPKGNFSNVARCRLNGFLLGPTNYHGYQPSLRKLFEERFSRRMSFSDFQREIEVVNDPALVEQWKLQASSITVYHLRPPEAPKKPESAKNPVVLAEPSPEAPPVSETPVEEPPAQLPVEAATETVATETAEPEATPEPQPANETPAPSPALYDGPVFATIQEVEQHFRENFLPALIRSASSFHISGEASRAITDRGIASAVRLAWEQERGFPGQMMHQLRQHFSRAGLHVFKHRKRMQFVSLVRPSPMENGSLSPSVAEILQVIQAKLNCNRVTLGAAILGADETAIDPARKSVLATDLHWLIETGRVIEFSDGRLELPVAPAKIEPEKPKTPKPEAPQTPASAPAAAEPQPSLADPAPELPPSAVIDEPTPIEPIAEIPTPTIPSSTDEPPAPQPEASSI